DDFRKALEAWSEYDANAGWGCFEILWPGPDSKLAIVLRYNFLMEDNSFHGREENLNGFMRGYIEGVFSAFPATMIEKAGLNPQTMKIEYDPTYSRDGRTLYSPDSGSMFKVVD
ncbi:MAG: hypothetical protein AAF869_07495, partial [Pseudomonadota bacterium]